MADKILKNKSIISDIWEFMKQNKSWWLLPIIIALILLAILMFISSNSPVSPFIYTLF